MSGGALTGRGRVSAYALTPLLLTTVLAYSASGCDALAAEHRDAVRSWHEEIDRNAWRCDVMGDRLQRWLDSHGKALARTARLLADSALREEGEDRDALLASLRVEPPARVREALDKCRDAPTVKAALDAWLTAMTPLIMMERAATSSLPALSTPDASPSPRP
jgi:hypothetical protein